MASDSFTDSNGTGLESHDANWTSIGGSYVVTNLEINSNIVEHESTWQISGCYYDGSAVDSSEIVSKAATFGSKYVTVRAGSSQRGYSLSIFTAAGGNWTQAGINKNGVWFATLSSGQTWAQASDHTLKVIASGTTTVTIEGFVDDVSQGTTNDSSSPLGTGHPGFWAGECATVANSRWDDWTDGAAAGHVNVAATTDALILTEYSAAVNAETNVEAGVDVLVITEYAATVKLDTIFTAGIDALVITEYSADVSLGISFTAGIDALILTEYAATVNVEVSISAGVDALILTEHNADVNLNVSVSAGIDTLVLTEYGVTVNAEIMIAAGLDALILSEYAASISVGAGRLFITEQLGLNQMEGLF